MVRGALVRWSVLALALLVAPTTLAAQQGGSKIGYINARAVLLAVPGYAQAESTYNRELSSFREEVDRMQTALDSAASDFEQKSVMLSATAKTAKRRELEQQRDRMEQRANELRDKAAQREQELLAPIHGRVNTAIEAVRTEGGFAIIFDVSANEGLIVAVDKSLELSQKVIDKVKATP
ncbi:MAG: OmpH family outer membrane protein [Gemmatimonadetes bacterium]|nr:OmpH family outer membrane protein [Gemmatimonadota bacterium]MBK6778956.1 OmpH family outer membrane protein [Gemmatimonadota bacterium]MBK7924302.1 OmpH family outer membrane protein [Gemmatimonadota bacterium]MBK9691452.1 OmpH family outer membrane protein [Gemmatimonadota bacterium]MBP6671243.1 OmpH family outer membrane protein [Gemmatimonadales bacterium]